MHAFLMGMRRRRTGGPVEPAGLTDRTRDHDLVYPPHMPVLPPAARGAEDEGERGFGPEDADTHAWPCHLCNHKSEIDKDKCIHCDLCIKVSPRDWAAILPPTRPLPPRKPRAENILLAF